MANTTAACAVATCSSPNNVPYFNFPKQIEEKKRWVALCKRNDKDLMRQKTPRICVDHFAEGDFQRNLKAELLGLPFKPKLKAGVLPSLNLPHQLKEVKTESQSKNLSALLPSEKLTSRKRKLLIDEAIKRAERLDASKLPKISRKSMSTVPARKTAEESLAESMVRVQPLSVVNESEGTELIDLETSEEAQLHYQVEDGGVPDEEPPKNLRPKPRFEYDVVPIKSTQRDDLVPEVIGERCKVQNYVATPGQKVFENKGTYVNNLGPTIFEMTKLKRENEALKKRLESCKNANANRLGKMRYLESEKYKKTVLTEQLEKIFTPAQARSLVKNKTVHWSEEDIVNGLIFCSISEKAYDYLRTSGKFPLPSKSVLRKWKDRLDTKPGIQHAVFDKFKRLREEEGVPEGYSLSVLVVGEMTLRPQGKGPITRVSVAMLVGLFHSWKQPIYFDFDSTVTVQHLMNVIRSCENGGFQIYGMVCSLKTSQLKKEFNFSENLEINFANPADGCRRVHVFFDMPELMLNASKELIKHGFHFHHGIVLKKDDFQLMIENSNIPHDLTYDHLHIDTHTVSRARAIFSNATSVAFKDLFPEKQVQGKMIGLFNDFFNVFDSVSEFDDVSLKCGFGKNLSNQLEVLDAMKKNLMSMRPLGLGVMNSDKPRQHLASFQRAMVVSINSLQGLYGDLRENLNFEYLMTRRFHRVPLQRLFSKIKNAGLKSYPKTNRIKGSLPLMREEFDDDPEAIECGDEEREEDEDLSDDDTVLLFDDPLSKYLLTTSKGFMTKFD